MRAYKKEGDMSNDERLAILETTIGHINNSLLSVTEEIKRLSVRIDNRFDKIDEKFIKVDEKFEKIEAKFSTEIKVLNGKIEKTNETLHSDFRWLITTILGAFVGILGIMAHGFHWIG